MFFGGFYLEEVDTEAGLAEAPPLGRVSTWTREENIEYIMKRRAVINDIMADIQRSWVEVYCTLSLMKDRRAEEKNGLDLQGEYSTTVAPFFR